MARWAIAAGYVAISVKIVTVREPERWYGLIRLGDRHTIIYSAHNHHLQGYAIERPCK